MYSLIAQLAEQPAVNRQVLGSSPSQGAWRYIEYSYHYLTDQVHLVRWHLQLDLPVEIFVDWLCFAVKMAAELMTSQLQFQAVIQLI
jgi:hypothetical protein